jgi:assimilatory nitrate reductase catalytic subunit
MVPVTPQPTRAATDAFYPLILNSGRIRDQWHTMTRTGAVPRLMQHIAEPVVEVAPADATRYHLLEGELARVCSPNGVMVAKVTISDGQRPGSLFVPMHWNNQFARQGRVNNLLAAVTDPHSGQPESKQAAVAIAAWRRREGFLSPAVPLPASLHWRRRAAGHYPSVAGGGYRSRDWLGPGASGRAGRCRLLKAATSGTCWRGIGRADARLVERRQRAGYRCRMDHAAFRTPPQNAAGATPY